MRGAFQALSDRLVVAIDYDPRHMHGRDNAHLASIELAEELAPTGVYVKVGAVLRSWGYELIDELHEVGVRVFADLKLIDIPRTLALDGAFLSGVPPELVTVKCEAGIPGMKALNDTVGETTDVLGVSVLSSSRVSLRSAFTKVLWDAEKAQEAGCAGLVLPAGFARDVHSRFPELVLHTPGIRPPWVHILDDDQVQVATPYDAVCAGADRIIVGRPVVSGPSDAASAVEKLLSEIQRALS